MTLEVAILAGLILCGGAIVQSAAGFGYGMFAIPLLMLLGFQSFEAITIVAVSVLAQTGVSLWVHRSHIRWKQVALLVAGSALTLPVGAWALQKASLLEPQQVRQLFGAIILIVLVVQTLWKPAVHRDLHWGWGVLAMLVAGFMAGFAGMGGPAAVLWVMAHGWENHRSRVTLWALFGFLTPLQLLALWQRFGESVPDAALDGLILTPGALIGLIPGLWIGHHLPKARLKQLSLAMVAFVALTAIIQPFLAQ